MELNLQIFFIVASLLTIFFILYQIRKHKLNINDSIVWLIWGIILLIISIFPGLSAWISKLLGFQSTSNFIFCLFTFFLYIMLFYQNIQLSSVKEQNKELTQKCSIYAYEIEEKNQKKS